MNTILKILLVLIVYVISKYIFQDRFDYLNIPQSQVDNFNFYFIVTILVLIFGILRFNNFFNPVSFLSLFVFSFAYSFI